jgi:hypothetical protein
MVHQRILALVFCYIWKKTNLKSMQNKKFNLNYWLGWVVIMPVAIAALSGGLFYLAIAGFFFSGKPEVGLALASWCSLFPLTMLASVIFKFEF